MLCNWQAGDTIESLVSFLGLDQGSFIAQLEVPHKSWKGKKTQQIPMNFKDDRIDPWKYLWGVFFNCSYEKSIFTAENGWLRHIFQLPQGHWSHFDGRLRFESHEGQSVWRSLGDFYWRQIWSSKLSSESFQSEICMESQLKPSSENWHSGWGVVSKYKLNSIFGCFWERKIVDALRTLQVGYFHWLATSGASKFWTASRGQCNCTKLGTMPSSMLDDTSLL